MARRDQSANPLQTLREATTNLEAAVLLCLAKPRKTAVHQLRTTSLRIEAQLELFSLLADLPPHEEQQREALRLLRKLRRAAGQVRDIDVQRDLIGKEETSKDRALRKQARELRRELKGKRKKGADHLQRLLHKQQTQLPLVFEELLETLEPAAPITLSESRLTQLVHHWYGQNGAGTSEAIPADAAALHAIRKRAKLARYLAETAPESALAARRLASRFEHLQQAGGRWHDWLLLSQVAAGRLGDSAELPQRFAVQAERSLRDFKRRLRYKI